MGQFIYVLCCLSIFRVYFLHFFIRQNNKADPLCVWSYDGKRIQFPILIRCITYIWPTGGDLFWCCGIWITIGLSWKSKKIRTQSAGSILSGMAKRWTTKSGWIWSGVRVLKYWALCSNTENVKCILERTVSVLNFCILNLSTLIASSFLRVSV